MMCAIILCDICRARLPPKPKVEVSTFCPSRVASRTPPSTLGSGGAGAIDSVMRLFVVAVSWRDGRGHFLSTHRVGKTCSVDSEVDARCFQCERTSLKAPITNTSCIDHPSGDKEVGGDTILDLHWTPSYLYHCLSISLSVNQYIQRSVPLSIYRSA